MKRMLDWFHRPKSESFHSSLTVETMTEDGYVFMTITHRPSGKTVRAKSTLAMITIGDLREHLIADLRDVLDDATFLACLTGHFRVMYPAGNLNRRFRFCPFCGDALVDPYAAPTEAR